MAEKEIVLTLEGKEKLQDELDYLENEKRSEVAERIRVAREFGDISENSEYDDAKNEQGMVEARIIEIRSILAEAIVISAPINSGKVGIGATVAVLMNDVEKEFSIVGTVESQPVEGRISEESPVGKAIAGLKVGDEASTKGPSGKKIKLKVLSITY